MYLNTWRDYQRTDNQSQAMGECEDFWQQSRCGYVTIPTLEQGGWQGLDRHFTPELRIPRTPNLTHPSLTQEV